MSNTSLRSREKACVSMSGAAFVQAECHRWMHQHVLDLRSEKGVDGVLGMIADESGVPFSKIRRIYYKLTRNILAWERDQIRAACDQIALEQEKRIERRLQNIRDMREARRAMESQFALHI